MKTHPKKAKIGIKFVEKLESTRTASTFPEPRFWVEQNFPNRTKAQFHSATFLTAKRSHQIHSKNYLSFLNVTSIIFHSANELYQFHFYIIWKKSKAKYVHLLLRQSYYLSKDLNCKISKVKKYNHDKDNTILSSSILLPISWLC